MLVKEIDDIASQALFFKIPPNFAGLPVYLKLEGLNLAGSIKLKTAKYLIHSLLDSQQIVKGKTRVIESSSGNLGVALSIVCKSQSIPFTCVTDPNTNSNNIKLMRLYGAEVICVNTRDENGGYLGTRIKTIKSILASNPNFVWTNQYGNISNPMAHYSTTAQEIMQEFPSVNYLFVGTGTSGTLMGCAKYFKEVSPSTKIIAVDVDGSVTFRHPAKKRYIPGLGTSIRPSIVNEKLLDEVMLIKEQDTIITCYEILQQTGLLVGGSTGTVLSAIHKKQNIFHPTDIVVAISPDFGERYLDSIYDNTWIKAKGF